MSRHNVVYVEACSFDNPLGGFVPGTKSTNKILRRSLLCKSRNNRLIRPSIPRHSSGESSRKYFPPPPLITDQRVPPLQVVFPNAYFVLFFLFVWGVFWRPTFTLSFNMFRFSIFCYDLEIIDSIKNATCVANFLQVICSIEF